MAFLSIWFLFVEYMSQRGYLPKQHVYRQRVFLKKNLGKEYLLSCVDDLIRYLSSPDCERQRCCKSLLDLLK